MSSNTLSIEDSDTLDISEVLSNKETQTSTTYITDSFDLVKGPSRPLPKGIDKSNEPPVNNILDYRLTNDPSNSKLTELEAESLIKNIINTNEEANIDELNDPPTSLNYYKDVARPYLNTDFDDFEEHGESLEKFLQGALEDIPDYQPCFEIYEGKQDILDKVNDTPANMDTIPNFLHPDQEEKEEKTDSETVKDTDSTDDESLPKSTPANISIVNPKSDSDPATDVKTNIDITIKTSVESITSVIKESITAIKQTAGSCVDKIETVIRTKKLENSDENPTFYAAEKPKVDVTASQNVQTEIGNSLNSLKNLLHNPSEQIATFTGACKDFAENLINNPNERLCAMKDTCVDFAENLLNNPEEKMNKIKETCKDYADKFYNTSKDAVTLITSESAKYLSKCTTGSNCDDNSNEGQHNTLKICSESLTNFFFKKAETKPVSDDPSSDKAITGSSRISDAIPPTVKIGFNKIKEEIVSAKFDKSSPYDKALPSEALASKPPEPTEARIPTVSAFDHTPDPPPASNVFEMIRSKIFSIFRDDGERSAEPVIQETQEDEEEDPFEKYMDQ